MRSFQSESTTLPLLGGYVAIGGVFADDHTVPQLIMLFKRNKQTRKSRDQTDEEKSAE